MINHIDISEDERGTAKSKGVSENHHLTHTGVESSNWLFLHMENGNLPIISPATITALQDLSAEGSSNPVGEQPTV